MRFVPFFKFAVLLWVTALVSPARAQEPTWGGCLIRGVRSLLPKFRRIDGRWLSRVDAEPHPESLPVRMIGSLRGRYGGRLKVVELAAGSEWYQNTAESRFRGDPRWLVNLLGEEAAAFLGVRQISDRLFLIPDAREANGAIEAFNAAVHSPEERIGFRFYEPKRERASDFDYGWEFAENGLHPIARTGREALHDVNYHLAMVFLPPEAIQHFRRQSRELLGFYRYLEDRGLLNRAMNSHMSIGAWLKKYGVDVVGADVDKVTAGIVVGLSENFPSELQGPAGKPLSYWVTQRIGFTKSPETFVRSKSGIGEKSDPVVREALETYLAARKAVDPTIGQSSDWTPEKLEAAIRVRFESMKQRMAQMQRASRKR